MVVETTVCTLELWLAEASLPAGSPERAEEGASAMWSTVSVAGEASG